MELGASCVGINTEHITMGPCWFPPLPVSDTGPALLCGNCLSPSILPSSSKGLTECSVCWVQCSTVLLQKHQFQEFIKRKRFHTLPAVRATAAVACAGHAWDPFWKNSTLCHARIVLRQLAERTAKICLFESRSVNVATDWPQMNNSPISSSCLLDYKHRCFDHTWLKGFIF